jgi:phytoene synthase
LGIDDALGEVVRTARDPNLAAVKLAWWREQLQALDHGPPPAEPRLRAVATELLPRGMRGADLAEIEDGWAALLQPAQDIARVRERGAVLFTLGANLVGFSANEQVGNAGRLYSEVNAARRGLMPLPSRSGGTIMRVPRAVRPLTALAALASRDLRRGGPAFESEATPGRSIAILRHRLTGSLQLLT